MSSINLKLKPAKFVVLFLIFLFPVKAQFTDLKPAKDFSFKQNGEKVLFESYCEGKITMLLFWNVCCSSEIVPVLDKCSQKYQAKGLNFLAISLDRGSTISKAKNFLKTEDIKTEVVFDKNGKIYRSYQGGFKKPVFIIIDENFNIAFRHDGKASNEFYEQAILKILSKG